MSSEIFTLEKLYQAYLDCRKRKKNTINALQFEIEREKNLVKLLRELKQKTYQISRHICFIITEPSPREVFAADFRDRVIHHLLYNEINHYFEKDFIENSFACREDKGTHLAVEQLKNYLKEIDKGFFLKLDIRSFFCSINKDILYRLILRKIAQINKLPSWKREVLWLCQKIIFHDPTQNCIFKGGPSERKFIPKEKSLFFSQGKGLPIGNLTSQFFANIYLNELDRFAVQNLKCQYYIRYVDDLVLLDKNKEKLKLLILSINEFLKTELDLELRLSKTKLQSIDKGISFLGYFIKPRYTLVRQKVVSRLKDRLYKLNKDRTETKDLKEVLSMINSYYGHFSHAFSFNLRKNIYENHLGKLREKFLPKLNYSYLKIC